MDQVWDYALDLKNFHETSHKQFIAPVLIASEAKAVSQSICTTRQNDKLLFPLKSNVETLAWVIRDVLEFCDGERIDNLAWEGGRYSPTPTIVEAAMALYAGHRVDDITSNDAGEINISRTSQAISRIIGDSKNNRQKSICFVTDVPGAGKTMVGLDIATKHLDKESELYSVFLSGNGPLEAILREALTRDKVRGEKEKNDRKLKKDEVMSEVKMFIHERR